MVFTWTSGTHDVKEFPNEAAYTDCNFGEATELTGSELNTRTYTADARGIFYFGSSIAVGDCDTGGQKLTLTVTGMFCMRVNSTSQLVVEACLGGFALGICT